IGGLKEKAIAALRARIKKVIIPEANQKDLVEIPKNIKRRLKFVPVTSMDEVLAEAMVKPPFAKPGKARPPRKRLAPSAPVTV
ncbi:MAG: hypothetical protein HY790_12215, partial [Deltaproteobacteria bacterium]|nr:hypothetical protein [Deltaproteobacteria bacterium]